MTPKTKSQKDIFAAGKKHYAAVYKKLEKFFNPYQAKTIEYYLFNQGYLSMYNKKII